MKKPIITILALAIALIPAGIAFADRPEDIVNNMFNEVLKRNPTPSEFDRYMDLVIENGWDNSDLKRVLRKKKADALARESGEYFEEDYDDYGYDSRDRDYHRYSDRRYYETRRWVEYAFEEKLNRLPTRRELNEYCDICLDRGYNRRELEDRIASDFRGERKSYRRDDNYHYDYDRYSSDEEVEIIIEDIFREEMNRDVDDDSMRKYRRLMIDDGWSERRVRNDIMKNPVMDRQEIETVVVRAFEDLLNRRPKPRERDSYVDDMIRYRWDELKVRDTIKRSREYRYDRPRQLIEQAYEEVLLRQADASAYSLTNTIVREDWNIEDVKNHLRKSSEYHNETIPIMLEIAYLELLNRKPDPYGINFYTQRAKDGWTFEEIKDHIRASDEYAEKH